MHLRPAARARIVAKHLHIDRKYRSEQLGSELTTNDTDITFAQFR